MSGETDRLYGPGVHHLLDDPDYLAAMAAAVEARTRDCTVVCRLGAATGVICADDECDLASGVRGSLAHAVQTTPGLLAKIVDAMARTRRSPLCYHCRAVVFRAFVTEVPDDSLGLDAVANPPFSSLRSPPRGAQTAFFPSWRCLHCGATADETCTCKPTGYVSRNNCSQPFADD